MHEIEFESCGRSMRWYEWLAGLLLLGAAAGVRAAPIYKCVDAEQHITYQQESCSAQQAQRTMQIAPPLAPALQYRLERPREQQVARVAQATVREHAPREMAYECRAGDGRLFYRLGPCPRSIPVAESASFPAKSHQGKGGNSRSTKGGSVQVAAQRVPRELACREIHRAGAISRNGHEFDEHVSTYERNLGHDPCKS